MIFTDNAVRFEQLEVLVLDAADRMLDMGFINDIRKTPALLPSKRQNLMFLAKFSDDIRKLAKTIVNNPVEISVTPPNATARSVTQWLHPVDKKQKPALLLKLITSHRWQQVLVFSKTKHGANKLVRYLDSYGLKAAAIHGNKSQGARTKALADFKAGDINSPVATDIAARGLDISQLPQLGCYLIGIALPILNNLFPQAPELRPFIVTGLLGSLTTFSSFSAEMINIVQEGRYYWAIFGVLLHVLGSLIMTLLGMGTVHLFQQ